MESWIIAQTNLGEQVTVKKIVDRFESKPYGWDLGSIEVVLGWLVGNGKVTLSLDANPVMRTEAAALIRNTGKQQHTVVAPQKAYDATKVAAFKKFCTDFFDEGGVPSDPTELARFGKDKLAAKRDELNALVSPAGIRSSASSRALSPCSTRSSASPPTGTSASSTRPTS